MWHPLWTTTWQPYQLSKNNISNIDYSEEWMPCWWSGQPDSYLGKHLGHQEVNYRQK